MVTFPARRVTGTGRSSLARSPRVRENEDSTSRSLPLRRCSVYSPGKRLSTSYPPSETVVNMPTTLPPASLTSTERPSRPASSPSWTELPFRSAKATPNNAAVSISKSSRMTPSCPSLTVMVFWSRTSLLNWVLLSTSPMDATT